MCELISDIGRYFIDNAVAFAALFGVGFAFYTVQDWKREYRFKRNAELLEEALVLFYQAEHSIAYLRNGFIFSNDLTDIDSTELDENYSKERYKYTHTILKRFNEKQHIFDKLYAIELRFRARFGNETTAVFTSMKEKVKELMLAADRYSIKGLQKDQISEIKKVIWKDCHLQNETDTYGESISKIIGEFEKLCRNKLLK